MGGRIGETIEFYYLDTEPMLKFVLESGSGHAIDLTPQSAVLSRRGLTRSRADPVGDPARSGWRRAMRRRSDPRRRRFVLPVVGVPRARSRASRPTHEVTFADVVDEPGWRAATRRPSCGLREYLGQPAPGHRRARRPRGARRPGRAGDRRGARRGPGAAPRLLRPRRSGQRRRRGRDRAAASRS